MFAKPPVEVESVRTALEAMRHAKSLGLVHPLAHFLSIRGNARQFSSAAEADTTIFRSLSHLIRQRLNHQRAVVALPTITSYRAGVTLLEDYRQRNAELEAWSLLYYRYVRVDLALPMDDLEKITGQPKRTLNRRQATGVARLTQALIRREERTRARYRQATLRAQLPLPYPPQLFGRQALIENAQQTLTSTALPRHLLLYGSPGVGKTWVALALAHRLIDDQPLVNVAWIGQPDTDVEQLVKQIRATLGGAVSSPFDPSFASQLQLTDTLIVLNHSQTLIENPDTVQAVLKTLGTARLLLVADHPSPQFTQMTQLRVPELDREASLAYLTYEATKISPLQAENVEWFDELYRQIGGKPHALQAALAMGRRYRSRLVSSEMYQTVWDDLPELPRLIWLVMAFVDAKKRSEDEAMTFMRGLSAESVRATLADLIDAGVLDDNDLPDIALSALARSFAINIMRESARDELIISAVQHVSDRLAENPDTADCLHLLKTIQNVILPTDLLIDLAYSFGPILERNGEWLTWVHYLELLHAAATIPDRLWIGLRLGISRRWLAQWNASAYTLSNVIVEAGHTGDFGLQADAIVELAVVQGHQGLQEIVQKLLSQANNYYQRLSSVPGMERVSAERSWAALDRQEVSLAQGYLARIVEDQQSGRWLYLAANIALRNGKLGDALNYAEQAQQAYQGDVPHFARASALLGQIHYRLGNYNFAIDHLSGALDLMGQTHDQLGHARTRLNLAAVYLGTGNLRKALDYLRDLPDDLERLGDVDSLKVALKNLELLNRVTQHWKSKSA